jgi:hypothetical protein
MMHYDRILPARAPSRVSTTRSQENVALPGAQLVGDGTGRRLHRRQGHHLQCMVLHNVTQRPKHVVDRSTTLYADARPW